MGATSVNCISRGTNPQNYWDGVATKISKYYLVSGLAEYKNEEYLRMFEDWNLKSNDRILITDLFEAALGNIAIIQKLSSSNREIVGLDVSPILCAKAKANLENNHIHAKIISGNVLNVPIHDGHIDSVISPSTFDHFPNIEDALKECFRILKPGGRLILALNSKDNPFFKTGVRMAERFKQKEYDTDYFYSVLQVSQFLKGAGFKVGRTTAIMHVPIGMTTLIEMLEAKNTPLSQKIAKAMISLCRRWGRRSGHLKFYTGWWVVSEGIKPDKL
jgi:SAM-dependent methyltransferase